MTETERIRAALRISHTDADEEITQTIAAAKADMEAVGIRQHRSVRRIFQSNS